VTTTTQFKRNALCSGSALRALVLMGAGLTLGAGFAAPAFAQAASNATTSQTTPSNATDQDQAQQSEDIVVTGTLLPTANGTPSPVTTVTAADLDRRGVSTIQDAVQQLASNNGPALTNSFSANGAFAGGASAVSLRGLSTNSTLVLFDGLRAAYYPLADDGTRNFVDLNTIPDDIVDRIEVLRDGASSSYGADAIAGVVNIITKREVKGLTGRAEAGIAQRGDGAQYRLSLTGGVGDLDEQGYNAYLSGFYYRQNILYNRDRGFPYNTDDHRTVCDTACGPNTVVNGLQEDNLLHGQSTAGSFEVRPYDPTNTTAMGNWQLLNPNCGPGHLYTLTPADRAYKDANGNALNATAPNQVCQVDYTNAYGVISPEVERFGLSGRVTAKVGDSTEAYAEVNFIQSNVSYTGTPATVYGAANTGIMYPRFRTSGPGGGAYTADSFYLYLPVYVCPERVNCATSANRTLNPNNPFAAQGQIARLIGRDLESVTSTLTRNRAYRLALGVKGDISENWSYDVAATAMHDDLLRRWKGYVYIQHLLDVINDGTYNFRDPSATPQSVIDYLKPTHDAQASSDQYQFQATVSGALAQLPGGPLQLAVGGSIRYEAVDAPSGNPDYNGPTERYFTLNAFGTKGHRYIESVFAELDAPVVDMVDVNLSGRYDKYSSGQDAFSPKVGVKFTPIPQVMLRGTYSRGFRIPSFGEANALPTTGYVTNSASLFNDTYLAQYGCTVATFNSCPTYIRSGSYGQTTLASPDLKPEKSRSFTGGIKFNPTRNIELTVDYYNIKKTGAITQPSNSPALIAYYSGQPIPDGYTVVADAPDPNFPNATPRVAFVQSHLINANTIKTSGLDFGINGSYDFGPVRWTSNADASLILKLETVFPDGTVERYDGTLGNFNLTAGSGTPKWHGTWVNTFDFGDFALSGTVNYFGGYDLSAMDQTTGYKDCGLDDGEVPCRVKSLITFDLNAQFQVNDKFTFYMNVINLFDRMPPVDPVTYGAVYYNPVQGGTAILGRYFKAGV
jgi:iron complex outermembrane receptor protein